MQPKSNSRPRRLTMAMLAGAVAFSSAGATMARADDDAGERASKIQVLSQGKISLADAIRAAEATGKGPAVDAGLELSKNGSWFEVTTRSSGLRVKHRIDPATGAIVESVEKQARPDDNGRRAAKVAAVAASPMTLLQAVGAAEGQNGKALSAEFDMEKDTLKIDVAVADATGSVSRMVIDPATGNVAASADDEGDDD